MVLNLQVVVLGRLRATALESDRNSQRLKQDREAVPGYRKAVWPWGPLTLCLPKE